MACFLALTGDAVDNIPGVPGVGRKTASMLFHHFESLAHLYDDLDRVLKLKQLRNPGFVCGQLRDHRESAFLARQLTEIACDVPIDADLERIARRPPDLDALNDFYDTVGFGRLLRNQAERIAERRLSFGPNRRVLAQLAAGAAALASRNALACTSCRIAARVRRRRRSIAARSQDVTVFSDRPCAADAARYEPDTSRVSTYSPPPRQPFAAAVPSREAAAAARPRAAGADQVRHAADCERLRNALKDVAARMRAGYSVKQGEQLRERKAKLEEQRRAEKCR